MTTVTNITTGQFGITAELDRIVKSDVTSMTIEDRAAWLSDWLGRLATVADVGTREMGTKRLKFLTGLSMGLLRSQLMAVRAQARETVTEWVPVRHVLPDAPCSEYVEIPADVQLDEKYGTRVTHFKNDQSNEHMVSFAPIVLVARVQRVDADAAEELEVAFLRDGEWHSLVAPRAELLDSRRVLKVVSRVGLPLTDKETADFVDVLSRFERHNRDKLPVVAAVGSTGWHVTRDGIRFFSLGETHIGLPDDMALRLVCGSQERRTMGLLRSEGSTEEWSRAFGDFHSRLLKANARAGLHPSDPNPGSLFAFCVYAALAAPLLEPTGTDNFIVHLGGDSTGGKTTTAKFAASVYGVAGGKENLIPPWDGTVNSAQAQAKLLNDLVLFLDDSQTEDREAAERAIYRLASGRERGRLNRDAQMAERGSWRSVIISTGEQDLSDNTNYTGAMARLVSVWGGPIPDNNKALADEINASVNEQFGTIGPAWIRHVMELLESDPDEITAKAVRRCADELVYALDPFLQSTDRKSILVRVANYFALVLLAARFAHDHFGWPWDPRPVVLDVFRLALGSYLDTADTARRAHEEIVAWMAANRTNFDGGARPEDIEKGVGIRPPSRGWYGRWEHASKLGWTAIDKRLLFDELERRAFDGAAVLRQWNARGWLYGQGRNITHPVSIGGQMARMIVLCRTPAEGALTVQEHR